MKLGKIALKIRTANTRFGNQVCGTVELDLALKNTLITEAAFVVPLGETVPINAYDNSINQEITERFGVICAVKMDGKQSDKTGITAYDALYDVRDELFGALLGWQLQEAESIVYYKGASIIGVDAAWLWYQYEFEYVSRVLSQGTDRRSAIVVTNQTNEDEDDPLYLFNKLYANFIVAPSDDLPYTGELPLDDGYPDVVIPDIAQMIDYDK